LSDIRIGFRSAVQQPMALSDVKSRIDGGHYRGNVAGFFRDMELIFTNALEFNVEGSEIYSWAQDFQTLIKAEELDLSHAAPVARTRRSPKPSTLNPCHLSRNPKPETRNPRRSNDIHS
jgi:hypothetical protein